MRTYYFYVQWNLPDPPFWWDEEEITEPIPCNFYVNQNSYGEALNTIYSLPGTIVKVLTYQSLNDFTEEELLNQHYFNINSFT